MVAEIGKGEPIVALRADIDALPIVEENCINVFTICGFMSQKKKVRLFQNSLVVSPTEITGMSMVLSKWIISPLYK